MWKNNVALQDELICWKNTLLQVISISKCAVLLHKGITGGSNVLQCNVDIALQCLQAMIHSYHTHLQMQWLQLGRQFEDSSYLILLASCVGYCSNWGYWQLPDAPCDTDITPPDQWNWMIALCTSFEWSFYSASDFFSSLSEFNSAAVWHHNSQLRRAGSVEKIRNCSKFDCCFCHGPRPP